MVGALCYSVYVQCLDQLKEASVYLDGKFLGAETSFLFTVRHPAKKSPVPCLCLLGRRTVYYMTYVIMAYMIIALI